MTGCKLTSCPAAAHSAWMERLKQGCAGGVLVAGLIGLSGCISIEAPDKPIVIELNINITQEVIYRLAEDAQNTIEENADIF